MKNMRLLSRALSVMLICILAAGMVLVYAPEANAASTGKLMKSVTHYTKSGSKWKKDETTEYTYNSHKDPETILITYINGKKKTKTLTVNEYTYKNGKKIERKGYDTYDYDQNTAYYMTKYDSEGRVKKQYYVDPTATPQILDWGKTTYTYGKNGYIKKIKDQEGYTSLKYTWNGKRPKTLTGVWDLDGEKNTTVYSKFNKKGYFISRKLYTKNGGAITIKYNFKNGLVRTITVKTKDGKNVTYEKFTITYTKKTIGAVRYRKMINSIEGYTEAFIGTTWY